MENVDVNEKEIMPFIPEVLIKTEHLDKEEVIKAHKAAVKNAEKKGLIVLIKPDETSKYNNLVDILDEMLICNVARYAIVDLSDSEKELVKNTK